MALNEFGPNPHLLEQYNHDMDATIEIVRREFGYTAKFARYAALKMRDALVLPTVLLDIVDAYMDEFISDDIWGILIACKKDAKKYKTFPHVILMAVGTDNLELYLELFKQPGLWAAPWGYSESYLPSFSHFSGLRNSSREYCFIQTIANILYWLGRGEHGSRWIAGLVKTHADPKVGSLYALR